jgi:hypothetical protein
MNRTFVADVEEANIHDTNTHGGRVGTDAGQLGRAVEHEPSEVLGDVAHMGARPSMWRGPETGVIDRSTGSERASATATNRSHDHVGADATWLRDTGGGASPPCSGSVSVGRTPFESVAIAASHLEGFTPRMSALVDS